MDWVNVASTVRECAAVTLSFNVSNDCSTVLLRALFPLSLSGQDSRNFNGKL